MPPRRPQHGRVQSTKKGLDWWPDVWSKLCGHVRCGLCGRSAHIDGNGEGRVMYRCRHRGQGCDQPRRTAEGLARAAVLGLRLLAQDEQLQAAIRRNPEPARRARGTSTRGTEPGSTKALAQLIEKQRKLLELQYQGQISADLFTQEEQRLADQIESAKATRIDQQNADSARDEIAERFDQVVELLRELHIDQVWAAATFRERRVLVEELVEAETIFPDHLEVKVAGAPRLNVRLGEVGLKESANSGVGGGTCTLTPRAFRPSEYSVAA